MPQRRSERNPWRWFNSQREHRSGKIVDKVDHIYCSNDDHGEKKAAIHLAMNKAFDMKGALKFCHDMAP